MKTIFINSPANMEVRNLLRSDFYSKIRDKKNMRFVFFVHPERLAELNNEFSSENIIFEKSPDYLKHSPKWSNLWQIFIHDSIHTITIKSRQKYPYLRGGSFLNFNIKRLAWFLGGFKFWRKFLRWFEYNALKEDVVWNEYFSKYKPDLVFAPALMIREDMVLLKGAKRNKIPTLGMVRSWDNLSSKLFLSFHPDFLLVQNPTMVEEAVVLDDYPKNRIKVVGFLQWNNHRSSDWFIERKEIADAIGLDTNKPWITYFSGPPFTQILEQDDHGDHLMMIRRVIKDVNFVASIHPIDEKRIKFVDDLKDVPILWLGRSMNFKMDEMKFLANLIRHSALIMNFGSSIALEAAILGTPIISLGFNGKDVKWEEDLAVAFKENKHLLDVVLSGGVSLVSNEKDLIESVNRYLKDRNYKKEGREKLVERLVGPVDGKTSDRIIEKIDTILGSFEA